MDPIQIDRYISVGHRDRYWYQQTENLFAELFGPPNIKTVTAMFAATSINSSLPSNIRLFRRAWHELQNNLPHVNYMPNIRQQLNQLRAGGELTGNKIRAFAGAMSGDVDAVVVDIWLLRAFGEDRQYKRGNLLRSSGATDKQFREIELWVRTRAKELNLQPRELSAMIWSGVRTVFTGNKQTRYHELLIHQMFNMYER